MTVDVRAALDALAENVTVLKILGSYPKSDPALPFRIEKEKMRMDRDRCGDGHERT